MCGARDNVESQTETGKRTGLGTVQHPGVCVAVDEDRARVEYLAGIRFYLFIYLLLINPSLSSNITMSGPRIHWILTFYSGRSKLKEFRRHDKDVMEELAPKATGRYSLDS